MTLSIPILVFLIVIAVTGAVIWWIAKSEKLQTAGKLIFFAAFLALMFAFALGGHTLKL
jgi:cytochrome b subunit of formate dehydrogenase